MRRLPISILLTASALAYGLAQARILTVTTADNLAPPVGQMSLLQALSDLQDGDEIRFNIPNPTPGAGPHFIETPPDGYPLITRNNIVIDGYTQPGATPNTNPILGANNAQIRIVLDSRNGNSRLLDFPGDNPNDVTGYGNAESAILGFLEANGVKVRGLCLLAVPLTSDQAVQVYGVAFAKGASGQVSGCWFGVAPDGATLAGPSAGITGFRYQVRDVENQVLENLLIDDLVVGVAKDSTAPSADFNVLTGIPGIPIIIEGNGSRIAGNFLGVLPDGVRDVNLSLDPASAGSFQGFIEIGRGANNTLIGTDGDGVNDANERNILGGTLPALFGGYDHSIEIYDPNPGTNIVVAGNFIGVAVDRTTSFTNGVAALNAAGGSAVYRFGSNFDGQSDDVEGNLVHNYSPDSLFNPSYFDTLIPNDLNFLSDLELGGIVSARGNSLVNNLPFPVSPTRTDGAEPGAWLTNYYVKALVNVAEGVHPVIAPESTATRLLGSVPVAETSRYPLTIVDVYIADPAGIATGQAVQLPELPHGFVQGRTYLGSFADDSPEDQDKTPGRFDFDIAAFGLTDALLTLTANYSTGPANAAQAVVLTSPFSDPVEVSGQVSELKFTSISLTPQGARLEWIGGGTLQASVQVVGGWQDVPAAASPHTTPAGSGLQFFRLRR